ncbi:MAG: B12-binding domain-containing radical SAM protein, partial [Planctomycetota bacterium]
AIGVESGNEELLEKIGKRETKAQFRDAVRAMKQANLPVIASYIIGLPGDTHETIKETMEFALELDADQSKFMILAPYPGTRVYDIAVQRGLVDPTSFEQMEDLNYYDSVAINLSEVSDEDLIAYQDQAYEQYDTVHAK